MTRRPAVCGVSGPTGSTCCWFTGRITTPPYAEPIAALEKLKQDGKIRRYGVSNFSPAMMEVCEGAGHLTANQVGYNLFDRRMERAVLPYTQAHGIGFMAHGTLCYGLLTAP